MQFIHAHWPDYYDTRPGGLAQGRSIEAPLFDVGKLGAWAPKLARHPMTGSLPLVSGESVRILSRRAPGRAGDFSPSSRTG